MLFELSSICGCAFIMNYDDDDGHAGIMLASHDSVFTRDRELSDDTSVRDLVEFVHSVALAAQADLEAGTPYANLVDQGDHYPDLGLTARFTYPGEDCRTVRAEFTALPDQTPSLGFCEVRVTLDLSVTHLFADAQMAYRQLT